MPSGFIQIRVWLHIFMKIENNTLQLRSDDHSDIVTKVKRALKAK